MAPHGLSALPEEQLWPRPHSKLFDFRATQAGAEYIDEIARAARERMHTVGEVVIGHGDWRAEHVRFVGDRPVAAFDWDSLCKVQSLSSLGSPRTRSAPIGRSRAELRHQPSRKQRRWFWPTKRRVGDRSILRSEPRVEPRSLTLGAYTARCGHALGQDQRKLPRHFKHLVAEQGLRLLPLSPLPPPPSLSLPLRA